MRKILRIAALLSIVLVATAAVLMFVAYRASQQVPRFYQQALHIELDAGAQAGDELERQVLDLTNEAREEGYWEAVFTDAQINGWLAVDLVEKFPGLLPKEASQPRVAINAEQAQVACQYQSRNISTVLSLAVEIYLTEEPNEVAIRLCKARAGILPVPLKKLLDGVTKAARRMGLPLRWAQEEGDPVALIKIPLKHRDISGQLQLEKLELRQGELYLAGRTDTSEEAEDAPYATHLIISQSPSNTTRQR